MATSIKKVYAHIPADLLKQACTLGNLNQTDALVSGLRALIAEMKRKKLAAAAGKFHFEYDSTVSRERTRL